MASKRFKVYVAKCEESGVLFIKESDIWGLHLEAPSIEEMGDVIKEFAPSLIMSNHPLSEEEMSDIVVEVYLVAKQKIESNLSNTHNHIVPRVLIEHQAHSL